MQRIRCFNGAPEGLRGGADDVESGDPMVFGKPRRPVRPCAAPKAKSEAKAAARSPSLGASTTNKRSAT